ncbi:unnamed protein product, partial [marine sediment metagenome]
MGARVQFTLLNHWRDEWEDRRCDKTIPAHLCNVENFSSWGADIATLTVFYDFGTVNYVRNFSPVAYLSWDIPVDWRVA